MVHFSVRPHIHRSIKQTSWKSVIWTDMVKTMSVKTLYNYQSDRFMSSCNHLLMNIIAKNDLGQYDLLWNCNQVDFLMIIVDCFILTFPEKNWRTHRHFVKYNLNQTCAVFMSFWCWYAVFFYSLTFCRCPVILFICVFLYFLAFSCLAFC